MSENKFSKLREKRKEYSTGLYIETDRNSKKIEQHKMLMSGKIDEVYNLDTIMKNDNNTKKELNVDRFNIRRNDEILDLSNGYKMKPSLYIKSLLEEIIITGTMEEDERNEELDYPSYMQDILYNFVEKTIEDSFLSSKQNTTNNNETINFNINKPGINGDKNTKEYMLETDFDFNNKNDINPEELEFYRRNIPEKEIKRRIHKLLSDEQFIEMLGIKKSKTGGYTLRKDSVENINSLNENESDVLGKVLNMLDSNIDDITKFVLTEEEQADDNILVIGKNKYVINLPLPPQPTISENINNKDESNYENYEPPKDYFSKYDIDPNIIEDSYESYEEVISYVNYEEDSGDYNEDYGYYGRWSKSKIVITIIILSITLLTTLVTSFISYLN